MTTRRMTPADDRTCPASDDPLTITLDGRTYPGTAGQTLAGVLLGNDCPSWRTSSVSGRPRGVFCGIGVCFDCIATVNDMRDVRLCQRRAVDGDRVTSQYDVLPGLDTSLPRSAPPPLLDPQNDDPRSAPPPLLDPQDDDPRSAPPALLDPQNDDPRSAPPAPFDEHDLGGGDG